jgi:hypothetical protein
MTCLTSPKTARRPLIALAWLREPHECLLVTGLAAGQKAQGHQYNSEVPQTNQNHTPVTCFTSPNTARRPLMALAWLRGTSLLVTGTKHQIALVQHQRNT